LRIDKTGLTQIVRTYEILGSGEPYTRPFIKTVYNNSMSMNRIISVSSFVMKLIEKKQIDYYEYEQNVEKKDGHNSIFCLSLQASQSNP
jgi:hypothetical protein